jgi:Flp pilus assembly pilin Flp
MRTITSPVSTVADRLGYEEGQALVEYALVLALVTVMGLALMPIGPWLIARFTEVATAL